MFLRLVDLGTLDGFGIACGIAFRRERRFSLRERRQHGVDLPIAPSLLRRRRAREPSIPGVHVILHERDERLGAFEGQLFVVRR